MPESQGTPTLLYVRFQTLKDAAAFEDPGTAASEMEPRLPTRDREGLSCKANQQTAFFGLEVSFSIL